MNENFKLKRQADLLFDSKKVANLHEFKEKRIQESLPSGYVSVTEDGSISFYYFKKSTNNVLDAPLLLGTVIVTCKLDFEIQMFVFSTSIPVPTSSYHHLLQSSTNTIKTTTKLLNLLSFCKSACGRSTDFSANTCILLVVSLLDHYIIASSADEPLSDDISFITFMVEQLKLYQTPKLGRRYSVELITTAFLWQLTSTALYKKLRQLLIFLFVSRLRQISSCISVETAKLDLAYLKQRISRLPQIERIVHLIIDEVYTVQRIEYCNGQFIGFTKD